MYDVDNRLNNFFMPEPIIMRVEKEPFHLLKNGLKIWEIRLNDEKRKGIRAGDEIVFMKRPDLEERLPMIVLERQHFNDVQRLLDMIPLSELGYEGRTELEFIQQFMTHYRPDEVINHGIVALKLRKVV